MIPLLGAVCGAVCGLGTYVLWAARYTGLRLGSRHSLDDARRLVIPGCAGVVAAAIVTALVGWWIVAGVVGVLVAVGTDLWRRHRGGRNERELVDAVAVWTEQLRDTLVGSHGLEQVIIATAQVAPAPIAAPVERLAASLAYGSPVTALRRFSEEVDHPTMDFVVTALMTALTHRSRDLAALLGQLAQCARDEGRMRSRVWVSRARTRSSVRIVAVALVTFLLGLFAFSPDYLAVYASTNGQLTLGVFVCCAAGALWMMRMLSDVRHPDRFVRKANEVRR
jgi:tight adherence protein B